MSISEEKIVNEEDIDIFHFKTKNPVRYSSTGLVINRTNYPLLSPKSKKFFNRRSNTAHRNKLERDISSFQERLDRIRKIMDSISKIEDMGDDECTSIEVLANATENNSSLETPRTRVLPPRKSRSAGRVRQLQTFAKLDGPIDYDSFAIPDPDNPESSRKRKLKNSAKFINSKEEVDCDHVAAQKILKQLEKRLSLLEAKCRGFATRTDLKKSKEELYYGMMNKLADYGVVPRNICFQPITTNENENVNKNDKDCSSEVLDKTINGFDDRIIKKQEEDTFGINQDTTTMAVADFSTHKSSQCSNWEEMRNNHVLSGANSPSNEQYLSPRAETSPQEHLNPNLNGLDCTPRDHIPNPSSLWPSFTPSMFGGLFSSLNNNGTAGESHCSPPEKLLFDEVLEQPCDNDAIARSTDLLNEHLDKIHTEKNRRF